MISNCQKYLAILLTFICVIVLYPQSTCATEAISQRETIRVGFFEMDGYHMQDETRKRSGYGYDTLRLMARYWNVRFEYIGYDKSWGNMQKMLEDNEIDIGTFTHKTPDWEKKFDFSRPIGSNECMITVRNDNTSFVVQDYTTYNMHNFLSASK